MPARAARPVGALPLLLAVTASGARESGGLYAANTVGAMSGALGSLANRSARDAGVRT